MTTFGGHVTKLNSMRYLLQLCHGASLACLYAPSRSFTEIGGAW